MIVKFSDNELPKIRDTLTCIVNEESIIGQKKFKAILEVIQLLGNDKVLCLYVNIENMLCRGLKIVNTRTSIKFPVGDNIKGRVLDILGRSLDGLPDPVGNKNLPIHKKPPVFVNQVQNVEILSKEIYNQA